MKTVLNTYLRVEKATCEWKLARRSDESKLLQHYLINIYYCSRPRHLLSGIYLLFIMTNPRTKMMMWQNFNFISYFCVYLFAYFESYFVVIRGLFFRFNRGPQNGSAVTPKIYCLRGATKTTKGSKPYGFLVIQSTDYYYYYYIKYSQSCMNIRSCYIVCQQLRYPK